MSIRDDLLKRRTELSITKQALLKRRLQRTETVVPAATLPPISKRPADRAIPLSLAQQRIWFLQELEPENPFYNELTAVRLSGPLNLAALSSAARATVQRHEILGTTFSRSE